MDLLLMNLQTYLQQGTLVLNSVFGQALLQRNPKELSKWRVLRSLKKESKRVTRFAWPHVRDGHWVAFFVDLEPLNVTTGSKGECLNVDTDDTGIPIFYAMDSMDVRQRPRRGLRRVDLTPTFQYIFNKLVHFMEFEHSESIASSTFSVFGQVPAPTEWNARLMDRG